MPGIGEQQRLTDLLAEHGGVVHLRDMADTGVGRTLVRKLLASGELVRLGKAAFVAGAVLADSDPWEQFRLRSIASGLCAGPQTYLTGWAAAVLHGLPLLTDPPPFPTGLRSGDPHRAPNVTRHGRVRWGHLPRSQQTVVGRVRTVGLAYTVVDVARHAGRRAGLTIADAALRAGVSREELARLASDMTNYPGIADACWVIERADEKAESPLESLGRLAFLAAGRPPPLSNPWIWSAGRWFRVDHLLPGAGVVLEGDGALKYNNRADANRVVDDEKERERIIRQGGFGMVRYNFSIATSRPAEILRRADDESARTAGRPITGVWQEESPW